MLLVMLSGLLNMTCVLTVLREQCKSVILEWYNRTLEKTGKLVNKGLNGSLLEPVMT